MNIRPEPRDVLGIDFGTSNTVVVLLSPGRPARVLAIDGGNWIPSAIFVEEDDTVSVGRDAERKSRTAPERFEPNPKRRIDDGDILLGARVVPVVDAIAAVLRRVADEARRQLNGKSPDDVHLTHPAAWGSSRKNVLLAAARAAGLGPSITLIPEPVAAAAHFASLPGKSLPIGSCLAVYDLGGGTFDCAVVGSNPQGFAVLAESGLPDVGGVDFDQAIVDHLGRTMSAEDPARWQALSRPRTASDRRAARTLREDVRAAKETLSRYAQTDLPMPEPFEDTLLTRKEFDGLVRPVIARTVDVVDETVRRAGLTPPQLAGIYLVGGSSRIPLVAQLIGERLGVVATTLDQPETSVAMGAALAPSNPRPQGATEKFPDGPSSAGLPQGPMSGPVSMPGGHPPGPGPQQNQPHAPNHQVGQPAPGSGPMSSAGPRAFAGPGQRPSAAPVRPNGAFPPGGPAPVAAGSADRKRNRLLAAIGAAIAVVVVVVLVVVLTSGGGGGSTADGSTTSSSSGAASSPSVSGSTSKPATTTSTGPTTVAAIACTTTKDSSGLTDCMKAVGGGLVTSTCTTDLSSLQMSTDDEAVFKSLTDSTVLCTDPSNSKQATLIMQATTAANAVTIWNAVKQQFTSSANGCWSTADRRYQGQYSSGSDSDGNGIVGWKSGSTPVVAFVAGGGIAANALLATWKTDLAVSVTGC